MAITWRDIVQNNSLSNDLEEALNRALDSIDLSSDDKRSILSDLEGNLKNSGSVEVESENTNWSEIMSVAGSAFLRALENALNTESIPSLSDRQRVRSAVRDRLS
jgi:hypothetical protein